MREPSQDALTVRFLGTGPAGGRPGRGRSRRMESSIVVASPSGRVLVDVTRDFARQARRLGGVDLAVLTHAHRDASGGLRALDRSVASHVTVLGARRTVRALQARHRLAHLELRAVASAAPIAWRDWRFVPLAVPHARDCTTFAWRIEHAGIAMVYASDVARLTAPLAALCAGCDLVVLDGATWRRRIFTHLELRATAPVVARWPVRRVLFTQLGRSTPEHEALDRWLRAVDPRLGAAYDGLALELSARSRRRSAAGGARTAA